MSKEGMEVSDKVSIDRELLSRAADVLGSQSFSAWDEIAEQLRAFIAQPVGAEGVELQRLADECDIEPVIRGKELLYTAPIAPVVQAAPVVTDAMREAAAKEMYRLGYGHHESNAESILIAAHAAKPDGVLVEALERASKVMWSAECNLDVEAQEIERVLTAYRSAMVAKDGEVY